MTAALSGAAAHLPAGVRQPERIRDYVSWIFDSRHWDRFRPRDGDIVVSTSYKSGTTWMQNILRQLIYPEAAKPAVAQLSPWIDRRNSEADAMFAMIEAQRRRRFLKSHLPLDALPYYPELRYIIVVRDPRDVFMSFWNHYSQMTDAYFARANGPGLVGPPVPRCPEDIHDLWARWITEGWFPWESEGWPHSGNLYHTASWWRFRQLENVLFVHFADLLADLPAEIARVAGFLDVPLTEGRLVEAARALTFDAVRRDSAAAAPMPQESAEFVWKDGLGTFFFRGTNGRWRGVLTEDELALYALAKQRCLSPEAAAYLEGGRAAWAPPVAVA